MNGLHLEWEVRYDLSRALADRLNDCWLVPARRATFSGEVMPVRYVGLAPVRATLHLTNSGALRQKVTFAPPRLPSLFPRQITHVLFLNSMDWDLVGRAAHVTLDTPLYMRRGRETRIDIELRMRGDE